MPWCCIIAVQVYLLLRGWPQVALQVHHTSRVQAQLPRRLWLAWEGQEEGCARTVRQQHTCQRQAPVRGMQQVIWMMRQTARLCINGK